MTIQTKATLKGYFLKGNKPTQSNYEDLIDTFIVTADVSSYVAGNGVMLEATYDPAGVAGQLIGVSASQSMYNKTMLIEDSKLTVRNNADTTKKLKFDLSAITTGTTVTAAVPDTSGTLAISSVKTSWTPVITFATPGDLNVAYTTQTGYYSKVGNMVTVSFNIVTSTFTHSTASGSFRITGLPYTSNAGVNSAGALQYTGITDASRPHMTAMLADGDNYITVVGSGSGVSVDTIDASQMTSGGTVVMRGTLTYWIA